MPGKRTHSERNQSRRVKQSELSSTASKFRETAEVLRARVTEIATEQEATAANLQSAERRVADGAGAAELSASPAAIFEADLTLAIGSVF
jgi:hypothetical protein